MVERTDRTIAISELGQDPIDRSQVDLVDLSIKQTDALTVLMTGRGEANFADLIKKIVKSKNLVFDMICLKPQVGPSNQTFLSTMKYKQAVLRDLIYTYKDADEIKVYEDRPKHTRGFREYFEDINKELLSLPRPLPRKPIIAEVIQVADTVTTLDPTTETAQVQCMINAHNTAINSESHALLTPLEIKRTVFFTGYLISQVDTTRLLTLVKLPSGMPQSEVKFLANNIMITPRPCPASILEKVGGIGRKSTWQVTGIGNHESRIWAARVTPIPPGTPYHTDNPYPIVVLAVIRGARPHEASRIQNWQPVSTDKQYMFQAEVGEKVQLRVEAEIEGEGEYESLFQSKNSKRQRGDQQDHPMFERDGYRRTGAYNDENRRPSGVNGGFRGGNSNRGGGRGANSNNNASSSSYHHHRPHRGAVRSNNHRSNNRGRGGRGGGYKSLDDVQNSSRYANQGSSYQPNYDDAPSQGFSSGADGYNASFPALGGADGGLPYGK
ncbi:MAG: hypothetical protein LQ352_000246 [Teloschistes flavicans]|nr:MAG: hypothetical protein LQ352_000246 [Teloschistes flavicans]